LIESGRKAGQRYEPRVFRVQGRSVGHLMLTLNDDDDDKEEDEVLEIEKEGKN
jgi:hypothetical protein